MVFGRLKLNHYAVVFNFFESHLLKDMFRKYDVDSSGHIDLQELKAAYSDFGLELSEAELIILFKKIDADGSGEIDFEEFLLNLMIFWSKLVIIVQIW